VSRDCQRCDVPTDSDSTLVGNDVVTLCDGCRAEFGTLFSEFLAGDRKPPIRGGCSDCGGHVEERVAELEAQL